MPTETTSVLAADFSTPPAFTSPTKRLHISYLQPCNPAHSTFLHHIWNTDDSIQAEGNTGLDTPEKAAKFIATRVQRGL
ncbi:hypothetical protein BDV29DRAFT_113217 [Aspergillus leporis]|uniref:Uncharacterized protein n=1 Tax=Aspergillus leporis TaxID=41062 RepID=A0A5N5X744_9EURO|nr:hypothetical protein BDV29DRAFT_113217 [Aspergillus leporis]